MWRWFRGILTLTAKVGTRLIGLFDVPTCAALVGIGLTAYGLHMLFPPLAYIVPGAALLTFGLWLAGGSLPHRSDE